MTYVVEVSGKRYTDKWYSWINYKAPKVTFSTKSLANGHAKSIRKKYHCKTRVISIGPING